MMLVKKGMVKKQCQSYKGVKILILLPGMHDIFLGKIQKNNLPHNLAPPDQTDYFDFQGRGERRLNP